ncbi:hypothetical protein BS47DRAFT_317648 [Hydnum rufescens UP504]|uniref:Uncharacterized protein n=1 Tax=Hydnum rufescens UP504 TaxID=1448309 RepID=A0A9P6DR95_9AGAM|nr:hypothetical protein BS47DRAFT_317648 [Hydnum rufescens UP504]
MPGETPSGRGSPYTQSQSRNPFRLFRKKSRGEASIPEAGAPGDGTSVHFADGPSQTSLPSGKAKKGGWRGILKRKKSEPTTDEPVPSAEAPELYPTRSNSPVIERQRLSIDPVHLQQNDDDSLYRQTLDDQDGPPPVVSLMTPETSPRQVLRRVRRFLGISAVFILFSLRCSRLHLRAPTLGIGW